MRLSRGDLADLLRSTGAILLAAGVAAWIMRTSVHHDLSKFAQLIVLLVPALLLYVLALREPPSTRRDHATAATSALAIAALVLATMAMFAFLDLVDASNGHPLYQAAVLVAGGALAAYTARRLRVTFAVLLAGLAWLVAWQLAWEDILPHVSVATTRSLLVLAAVLLLAVAARLARTGAIGARELVTVGGISAVAAGVLGVAALGSLFSFGDEESSGFLPSDRLHHHTHSVQHFGWNLYLLVVSTLLLWLGARSRARGPAYVGGIGLFVFLASISVRIDSGEASGASLAGWPFALLLLGMAGLASPRLLRRE